MEFSLFNVGHGSCAFLLGDRDSAGSANVALFDCGHDEETGFRPSTFLRSRNISVLEHLFISHYDQDHLSDLPTLRHEQSGLEILSLWRNRSLSPDDIVALKRLAGPLELGVEAVVAMARRYN